MASSFFYMFLYIYRLEIELLSMNRSDVFTFEPKINRIWPSCTFKINKLCISRSFRNRSKIYFRVSLLRRTCSVFVSSLTVSTTKFTTKNTPHLFNPLATTNSAVVRMKNTHSLQSSCHGDVNARAIYIA